MSLENVGNNCKKIGKVSDDVTYNTKARYQNEQRKGATTNTIYNTNIFSADLATQDSSASFSLFTLLSGCPR